MSGAIPPRLPESDEPARKAMGALMSALTSGCECEACRLLREMGQDLLAQLKK